MYDLMKAKFGRQALGMSKTAIKIMYWKVNNDVTNTSDFKFQSFVDI